MKTLWNAREWAEAFKAASAARYAGDDAARQKLYDLRIAVFKDTVARVKAGGWYVDGKHLELMLSPTLGADTRFYSQELSAGQPTTADRKKTVVEVREGDCLLAAHDLVVNGEQETCVLNMASGSNPGGGVSHGAGAQEEHLFRSSDYFRSLYQFVDYGSEYGISRAVESYPLDRDFGGVFTRRVTIFRGPEADGYPLLDKPWRCNFVAVPAISNPATVDGPNGRRLRDDMVKATRRKIRAILRIARENGQRALVLSAFGCGAYHNPPRHIAELFRDELAAPEFQGVFSHIVFSIINDHNARGEGNLKPFEEVFAQWV